eukprot:TRINITY_DN4275_c0_g1_i1.p1 TRINITY_DN4275_c0_g1~~TRINITY_DN4275_c0_g1_i1.p1  ORF type:complete len:298 (-),score=54.24 TRINITY_DN4275_c0_g1_i1:26-919(-)
MEDFLSSLQGRCLFAIPKKGRLCEKVTELLKAIDLQFTRVPRLDLALSTNWNIALVFLPAADIAFYTSTGRVDVGITGQDIVRESKVVVHELEKLRFGKCKLCLQTPKRKQIKDPKELVGHRIVTSFPNVAKEFFETLDPEHKTSIKYVSGSVEVSCALGTADAIIDLVESGATMEAAGLEICSVIMETEAVLVQNPSSQNSHQATIDRLRKRIHGVILATHYAMIEYNIKKQFLEEAKVITPGHKSPTVSFLADQNWLSVKSLIPRKSINDILDKLEKIGADSVLVFKVETCDFND